MVALKDLTTYGAIIIALVSLGLFIFGINLLGDGLKDLAGHRIKKIVEKATNTPIKGILTGIVITALLHSSAGVTAIVIGLIAAGLMTLKQGISVIMGANIGTTFTAILISLPIDACAPYLIILGVFFIFFIKKQVFINIGRSLLGLGLLFFGLYYMGQGIDQIIYNFPQIEDLFLNINPYLASILGAIITALFQSSTAVVGIVQKLYESVPNFPLIVAIAVIIGSNIGTTVTALFVGFTGNKDAKRAALAHLAFNVIGAILFLAILYPFAALMNYMQANVKFLNDSPKATIALVHFIFNFTTTLILYFFINGLVKLVTKIIPYDEQELLKQKIDRLEPALITKAPLLAMASAHDVITDMGQIVIQMFDNARKFINENNHEYFDTVQDFEEVIDNYDHKLHEYLTLLKGSELDNKDMKLRTLYLDTIRDYERIADHCVNLVEFMETRYNMGQEFLPESLHMINDMIEKLTTMVSDAVLAVKNTDMEASFRIGNLEQIVDDLEKKYRRRELNLMAVGAIPDNDVHYVDILANLERIGDHTNNVADNIKGLYE